MVCQPSEYRGSRRADEGLREARREDGELGPSEPF